MNEASPTIVLHIPHAATVIPDDVRKTLRLSDTELEHELLCMTDAYTDKLFEYEYAHKVRFPVSRLVVDPERFAIDRDEPMAAKGMGVVYRKTANGLPLRIPGSWSRTELLKKYYEPHHRALTNKVAKALKSNAECVIVDCHSFPSKPLPYEDNPEAERPDLCIGTDSGHTPDDLVDRLCEFAENAGLSVALNQPFSGALVPAQYYRDNFAVFSVMIEVNRRLYMNETTGEKLSSFGEIKDIIYRLIDEVYSWQVEGFDERLRDNAAQIGGQDWDSGGLGAGAGSVTAYDYYGTYIVDNEIELTVYPSRKEALASACYETDATTEVWSDDLIHN